MGRHIFWSQTLAAAAEKVCEVLLAAHSSMLSQERQPSLALLVRGLAVRSAPTPLLCMVVRWIFWLRGGIFSSTPESVFRRMIDLMLAKDMNAVADLWAHDGTAEFPFAVGSSPRVLCGREEVRAYLAHYPELMDMKEMAALTVWPTDRTDTIVVEWTATGSTVANSQPYSLDYIVVLTVRDGLIALFRDYWSPLSAAAAAGSLPGLIASLERENT